MTGMKGRSATNSNRHEAKIAAHVRFPEKKQTFNVTVSGSV
jgi:hypothetical protein